MMINHNYADIINQAKLNNASSAHFPQTSNHIVPSAPQDKVTLSAAAMAKTNGNEFHEPAPTYVKPESANTLLSAQAATNNLKTNQTDNTVLEKDERFTNMMQSILDKRLGIDREKLAELEAMMEEIAKNENLSPEEKQKAIAELEKMREELIKESIEIKKSAKQSFADSKDSEQ